MENLPPLRDVLNRHDLFAKKSFGQHFLLDLNLTDKIARLAAPHPAIVEVGPGPGGLTRSLINAGTEQVYLIEKDFYRSFLWTLPLIVCSFFGIIHSTEIGFAAGGVITLGYLLFGAFILLVHFYNRYNKDSGENSP